MRELNESRREVIRLKAEVETAAEQLRAYRLEVRKLNVQLTQRQERKRRRKRACFRHAEGLPRREWCDPEYQVENPRQRALDAVLWAAENFGLCLQRDKGAGAVIHVDRAKTRPPTDFALTTLEIWAETDPGKREIMISKVLSVAKSSRAKDSQDSQDTAEVSLSEETAKRIEEIDAKLAAYERRKVQEERL